MTHVRSRYGLRLSGRPRAQVDVDLAVVDRLVAGQPVTRCSRAERDAAIATLTRFGYTAPDIARRTGFTDDTVYRARARLAARATDQLTEGAHR